MEAIDNLILFFPFFVSLFWGLTLFANRNWNAGPQHIWIAFLAVCCVDAFIWGVLFSGTSDYHFYYKLDIIDITLTLSFFPIIYLYFRSLTQKGTIPFRQYLWFTPGLLVGVVSAILYGLMGEQRSAEYVRELIVNPVHFHFSTGSLEWMLCQVSVRVLSVVLFVQVVSVMLYSTLNLVRYKKGLSNFFSNLDETSIRENRAVLISLFVLLGIAPTAICLWSWDYERYHLLRYVLMGLTGALIYSMSFHVSRMRFSTEERIMDADEPDDEVINPAEMNASCLNLLPRLVALVEDERLFLQPELTLNDIALKLKSNRTYVSHIINTSFQCTFYEFINRKRIDYAKELITQKPGLSQEQMAEQSGFASTSTFSRVFKKQTGSTFSEWRKAVINPQ